MPANPVLPADTLPQAAPCPRFRNRPRNRQRLTQLLAGITLAGLLLLLPLQWITLAHLGGFAVRIPYPMLLVALMIAGLFPVFRAGFLQMLRRSRFWLVPILLYLLIVILALYGSPGQGSPVRQFFFAGGSMALGGCILALGNPRPILRMAAFIGLVGFPIITEIIGRMIGTSWAEAIRAFLGGDLAFVIYGFLRNIYNFFGEDSASMVVASEKNAISASLLVALILFRAAGPRRASDWAGMVMTALTIGLLLILNTRSVLFPLALALILAPGLRLIRQPGRNMHLLILWAMIWVAVLVLIATQLMEDSPLRQLLLGRFSLTDASSSSRVTQQIVAIQLIENAILTGNGYTRVDGAAVHNLFLGAFVQAGLAAFLLTLGFYLAITLAWLRMIWRLATKAPVGHPDLRPEWVAMLPVLPLIRVWLTGDSGHPGVAEWVALGCFFALASGPMRAPLTHRAAGASPDRGCAPGPAAPAKQAGG